MGRDIYFSKSCRENGLFMYRRRKGGYFFYYLEKLILSELEFKFVIWNYESGRRREYGDEMNLEWVSFYKCWRWKIVE